MSCCHVMAMMTRGNVRRIRGSWIRSAMGRRRSTSRVSHGSRRRSCSHARGQVLAIGTTAIPATIRLILEAFAIFFEAKRFATLATILVDSRRVGRRRILRTSIVWLYRRWSRRRRRGWRPSRRSSRVRKARRRHGWIPHGELLVKSRWISLQNGFTSSFDSIRMRRVVVAILALAARATSGGRGKALTIQLETPVRLSSTKRTHKR